MNLKKPRTFNIFTALFFSFLFTLSIPASLSANAGDEENFWEETASGVTEPDPGPPPVAPSPGQEINVWTASTPPRAREIYYLYPSYPSITHKSKLDVNLFYIRNSRISYVFRDHFDPDHFRRLLEAKFLDNGLQLASLLEQFTIQERRLGALARYSQPLTENLRLEISLPLMISLRHFWVASNTQKQLKALFASISGSGGPSQVSKDLEKVLKDVPVKPYMGDMGLRLSYVFPTLNGIESAVGAELLLPTSSLLYARNALSNPQLKPTLTANVGSEADIVTLFNELKLVSMRPSFGSEGHMGIGGFFQLKFPLFCEGFDFWNVTRFNYYLPRAQFRFIPIDNDAPSEFEVKLFPGAIAHVVMGLDLHVGKWLFQGGYDFYAQNKEYIAGTLNRPEWASAAKAKYSLAEKPFAVQHKLFGSVGYCFDSGDTKVEVTLGLDATVAQSGIGRGYTGMINVGVLF